MVQSKFGIGRSHSGCPVYPGIPLYVPTFRGTHENAKQAGNSPTEFHSAEYAIWVTIVTVLKQHNRVQSVVE